MRQKKMLIAMWVGAVLASAMIVGAPAVTNAQCGYSCYSGGHTRPLQTWRSWDRYTGNHWSNRWGHGRQYWRPRR